MKGFQLTAEGNWGHFKKPETNNNPLTHDLITKTALIGMIGALLGRERGEMKDLFPQLSEDLLYGVQLMSPVKKVSWGFTSKTAINPTEKGTPKYFEFLKSPHFLLSVALKDTRSKCIFDSFKDSLQKEEAVYTPVLGWHNCPANLKWISEGDFFEKQGNFETKGFVSVRDCELLMEEIDQDFRIGFDKLPTFQNNEFWNLPEKYKEIVYPDYHSPPVKANGKHYTYISTLSEKETQWVLM